MKKEYKRLAMKHHPDINGGSEKDMKEINAEYDSLFATLKNVHQNSSRRNIYYKNRDNGNARRVQRYY